LVLRNILRYGLGNRAKDRKQKDKLRQRLETFKDTAIWDIGDIARRNYSSYEEYVSHQKAKLEGHLDQLTDTEEADFQEFRRRFNSCRPLSEARSVLCLGARLGTEVRALHSLGYFAVGIDLNPGLSNSYVLGGDFHHTVFADASIDAVYTNALDHSFDLQRVFAEVNRVLRARGLFIVEFPAGFEEGKIPGNYEAIYWKSADALLQTIGAVPGWTLQEHRDLGTRRSTAWHQAVFRKESPNGDSSTDQ
jgi:SAM-dependent methyltransferase